VCISLSLSLSLSLSVYLHVRAISRCASIVGTALATSKAQWRFREMA
jgi:hypothetical protein